MCCWSFLIVIQEYKNKYNLPIPTQIILIKMLQPSPKFFKKLKVYKLIYQRFYKKKSGYFLWAMILILNLTPTHKYSNNKFLSILLLTQWNHINLHFLCLNNNFCMNFITIFFTHVIFFFFFNNIFMVWNNIYHFRHYLKRSFEYFLNMFPLSLVIWWINNLAFLSHQLLSSPKIHSKKIKKVQCRTKKEVHNTDFLKG